MKTFVYEIRDAAGLHARPAGALVKAAKQFQSRITVSANGKQCEATRLMALMGLGARCGTAVTVTVEGADEEEAFSALTALFEQNL